MTDSSRRSRKKKTEILKKIVEEIRTAQSFLIVSHENPEGDAIGSMLALALALKGQGKRVWVLNQDPIPQTLMFLPGAEGIQHQVPVDEGFDIAFALDCGDQKRLGKEFAKVRQIGKTINIDHHVSNQNYGDIHWVDPAACAAAEMVFDLLRAIPATIDLPIAENIYTGVLTDTGSFHYSNTSPKALGVARTCLLAGVDPWKVAEKVYESHPLPRLRLLPLVLETLAVTEEGRVSSVVITQKMLEEVQASVAMTEDFINFPRSLEGAEVALLFREITPEKYRVSLRSRRNVDVSRIAMDFEGGGHRNAAGCTVAGSLSEVKAKVLERVRASF